MSPPEGVTRLVISCPDRPGIVAAVSRFLFEEGANVISLDQFSSDPLDAGTFFLRMEFILPPERSDGLPERFGLAVAERWHMTWRMWSAERPKRIAVLVSREDHCLQELLWRWRRHELSGEIVLVASNHPDHREAVEGYGLIYHHVPVTKEGGKARSEARLLELLSGQCDLIVLARYMQILSGEFLERVAVPVINIHHSFLPAFAGANPYRRAREHGVKLIGATAHYVTAELDGGPIIEQDVARVDHRQSVSGLEEIGRDIERLVLSRAVSLHLEDRVIADGGRTIVF